MEKSKLQWKQATVSRVFLYLNIVILNKGYPKMPVPGHKQCLPFIAYLMARAKAEASSDAQDES